MKGKPRQSRNAKIPEFPGRSDDFDPARDEMIERGRLLLQDPNYPNMDITREIAGTLLTLLY